jgi:hypothetical protein
MTIISDTTIGGLYFKHFTIINYDSSVINKLGASLTDDARVVIYYRHMFIVLATGASLTIVIDGTSKFCGYIEG